jgi:RecB family endonuclease NucS
MRVIIAELSVVYTGRGDTYLPPAVRALILKGDGAVSIHDDAGNKPLNYMNGGKYELTETQMHDGSVLWSFDTRQESIQVSLHRIVSDTAHELDVEAPRLERDGTESQLQEWIAQHPESIGPGFTFVAREYATGAGPVDILVADASGRPVVVEVKRTAMLGACDQVGRYVAAIREQPGFEDAVGIIAALDIRPKTQILADKRGIETVTLPAYWRDHG